MGKKDPESPAPAGAQGSPHQTADPRETEPARRDYEAEVLRALEAGAVGATLAPDEIERIKGATVLILTADSSGTGFVFARRGNEHLILTNQHVVGARSAGSGRHVRAVFRSGSGAEVVVATRILAVDGGSDLAILEARGLPADQPVLTLAERGAPVETESVLAVGFPFGPALGGGRFPSPTFLRGSVSSLRYGDDGDLASIQLDADLNPGSSGGPVLDGAGEVIGIAVAGIDTTDISFIIPSAQVQDLLGGNVESVKVQTLAIAERNLANVVFELGDPLGRIGRVGVEHVRSSADSTGGRRMSRRPGEPGQPARSPGWERIQTLGTAAASGATASLTVRLPEGLEKEDEAVWLRPWSETPRGRVDLPPFKVLTRGSQGYEVVYRRGGERGPRSVALDPIGAPKVWHLASDGDEDWERRVRPPRRETRIPLPDPVRAVDLAGGGRYLVLRLGDKALGIFDLVSLELEHLFPTVSGDFLFAAGGRTLLLYYPGLETFHAFDLETRERTLSRPADVPGRITTLTMGRSNGRTALVGWGRERVARVHWALLDTRTGRLGSLDDEACRSRKRLTWDPDHTEVEAAPDLRFFVAWDRRGHRHMARLEIDGEELLCRASANPRAPPDCLLADSGVVACSGYSQSHLLSDDLAVLEQYGYQNALFLAPRGSLFLRADVADTGDRAEVESRVHATASQEALLPVDLPREWLPERWVRQEGELRLARHVVFLPHAGLIVGFPPGRREIVVRPFDLAAALDGAGGSYLVVVSQPPVRAVRGSRYSYQLRTESASDRVTYVLESGPEEMGITPRGSIRWEVPLDVATEPRVVVKVLDGDGNVEYQSWDLRIE